MRSFIAHFLLLLLLAPTFSLQAQNGCRVVRESLKPIIQVYNPFFTDHRWDNARKSERARLDEHRALIINQAGCKRHHIALVMVLDTDVIENHNGFWNAQTKLMMHAVFFQDPSYALYRKEFEQTFAKKLKMYGLNQQFNFPIGTRNFVCEIKYDPNRGANIRIELVTYVFAETVLRKKGIARELDDGWFPKGPN